LSIYGYHASDTHTQVAGKNTLQRKNIEKKGWTKNTRNQWQAFNPNYFIVLINLSMLIIYLISQEYCVDCDVHVILQI
jgi:hypothetical protein